MIKVGDKVYTWDRMDRIGVVKKIQEGPPPKTYFVGGTVSTKRIVEVDFGKDQVLRVLLEDLIKSDSP